MSEPKFINVSPKAKEIFKALVTEFNMFPPAVVPPVVTPPPAKFGEGKLKDGTAVKWDGEVLAAGIPLMVVDPANPAGFLPAPDGNHELEDGTIIVVSDGKITEVKPVTPPEPVVTPDMSAQVAQMSKELGEVKAQFAAVSKEKTDLETKFTTQFEATNKAIEANKELTKKVFELVGAVLEQPQAEPIEPPANPKKESKSDRLLNKIQTPKK